MFFEKNEVYAMRVLFFANLGIFFYIARCSCADALFPVQYGQKITHDIVDFDVTVAGTICWADGIGRQPIELIDCLKNELVINFVNTRTEHEINLNDVPEDVKNIIINRKKGYSNVVILEDTLCEAFKNHDMIFTILKGTSKTESKWYMC